MARRTMATLAAFTISLCLLLLLRDVLAAASGVQGGPNAMRFVPRSSADSREPAITDQGLSVRLDPSTQDVLPGEKANFSVTIESQSAYSMFLTVSDPMGDANCIAVPVNPLLPSGSVTYPCTSSGFTDDFSHVITVTGTYTPAGSSALSETTTSTADVNVVNPAISVAMTPSTRTIVAGQTATFTVDIWNVGDVPLNLDVNAPPADSNCLSQVASTLLANDHSTHVCTRSNIVADFTSMVMVTGTYTPTSGSPHPFTSSDQIWVVVKHPAIEVSKTPQSQMVRHGDSASFTVIVTNSGNVPLQDVTLIDSVAPGCNHSIPTLAQTYQKTCNVTSVTADFINAVTVTAFYTPPGGVAFPLTASDSAEVQVISPDIEIELLPDVQTVASGASATFLVNITNTGDITLTNVSVVDARAPDCNLSQASMASGEEITYTCVVSNVLAPFSNVARVSALDPLGQTVSNVDTVYVNVKDPKLSVFMIPDVQTVIAGGNADFTIEVFNTGEIALDNVLVTDQAVSDCERTFSSIAPGNVRRYDCTATNVGSAFDHLAVVTAVNPLSGLTITTTAVARVEVLDLSVGVTAVPSQLAEPGGQLQLELVLTNTGSLSTTVITVTNSLPYSQSQAVQNNCNLPRVLPAGAGGSLNCTVWQPISGQPGTIPVTVTVNASGGGGMAFNREGSTTVVLTDVATTIDILIAASQNSLPEPGGSVTLDVRVENAGTCDLVTIEELTDVVLGDLNGLGSCYFPQDVEPGKFYQCDFTLPITGTAGFSRTHELVANGHDDDGQAVSAIRAVTLTIVERAMTYLYLPAILHGKVAGEPNNSCQEAQRLYNDSYYQFMPEDTMDWYWFELNASADTTVELDQYLPSKGQIVVYAGSCASLRILSSNGGYATSKPVPLGVQPPGRYYILVYTDEGHSNTVPYRLRINTHH